MDKFDECVTVHFKDDNGEFTEKHSLMSITRFSTVTASKIVRFEPFGGRVRELEVCLEDITRTCIARDNGLFQQVLDLKEFAQKGLDGDKCFKNVITEIREQNIQINRLKVIVTEREQVIDEFDSRNNPATAAIAYALGDGDGIEFLRCWNEGDFDALRKEWDDVPDEVFIGADPLFGL